MFILSASLLLNLLIPTAYAGPIKQNVVVKVKNKAQFEKEYKGENYKNLFSSLYVLRSTSLSLNDLKKNSNFEFVELENKSEKRDLAKKEMLLPLETKSNIEFRDPMLSNVWAFEDSYLQGMSVYEARRQFGFNPEASITVAVIDTGVDYTHNDLKNVMWKNTAEIPGNGIDDDGNGYIDDVYGINTIVRLPDGSATGDMKDSHSHGTHVAGTIGAESNNQIGIAGIASNVKIMGIRAVPEDGDESDIDIAEAMIYAANNGAKVINCSFGKKTNEGGNLIPETLKYLNEKGVVVVVSAGNDMGNNDRTPKYPANHMAENMIVVASTTKVGTLSYFSNYGVKTVHVAAPGSTIYSTTPNNKYEYMSGTSMAAPAVSGLVAEVLSFYPHLSPIQVRDLLITTSDKSAKLREKTVSGGKVNLLNALEGARGL